MQATPESFSHAAKQPSSQRLKEERKWGEAIPFTSFTNARFSRALSLSSFVILVVLIDCLALLDHTRYYETITASSLGNSHDTSPG